MAFGLPQGLLRWAGRSGLPEAVVRPGLLCTCPVVSSPWPCGATLFTRVLCLPYPHPPPFWLCLLS